jgi:hypothetical protein
VVAEGPEVSVSRLDQWLRKQQADRPA